MPTRTRRSWKPDSRGYYTRQIGWKRSNTGKLQQHKFILGTDRREAERREHKLRELWDAFAADAVGAGDEGRVLWDDGLLEIAMSVAKGHSRFTVPRGLREACFAYTNRIQELQARFPVIAFVPEDLQAFSEGVEALATLGSIPQLEPELKVPTPSADVWAAMLEASARLAEVGISVPGLPDPVTAQSVTNRREMVHRNPRRRLFPEGGMPKISLRSSNEAASSSPSQKPETQVKRHSSPARNKSVEGSTLYQAFRRYQEYLQKEYYSTETGQITPWGQSQIRQVKNLEKHHDDLLLSELDADAVGELVGYWRRRPCRTGTNRPMTAKSTSNYLGTLMRFLKWLDNTSQFGWKKPLALSDLNTRVRRLPSDHARKGLQQVDTFTLEELQLLMRYGQPLERLLLLLGLNCGFGRAEIASLLVAEVHLFKTHQPQEKVILDFESTEQDSFIKRVRRKSGVYGEHILFPLTVTGLQWALEKRKAFPDFGGEARVLLNEKGHPLDRQTASGNANQTIPNHWQRLLKRIQDDGHQIRPLSFGKLRKTASDLIRRFSDGEIAAVFDCHGTPVKSDDLSDVYTNRPFGKVFRAIRDVEQYLAPVFREAGRSPFSPQPQAYTQRSTIDRIVELYTAGYPVGQIAASVGLSGATVSRHLSLYRNGKTDESDA